MNLLKYHKSFEGLTQFWQHPSRETKTQMKFSTFIPAGKVRGALIFLAGLTCTEENFMAKAGAQKYLAEAGLMVICPDTSPRGLNLPHEHDSDDFGSGAGFYVNAATPGYQDHYRMYSYVTEELHVLLQTEFKIAKDKISICGHSMGGHGALIMALREPTKFKSVSAFSPIAHPMSVPWGEKAFAGYLGTDQAKWNQYDATELVKSGHQRSLPIYIDQGTQDPFLEKQLRTVDFENACRQSGQSLNVQYREGYDHSYYFIASFIADHVSFHAKALA
jgi:S-formylglutathione hydrolase